MQNIWESFQSSIFKWILTLVLSLSSFYVTTVVEEVRSGHSAIYSFVPHRENGNIAFHLHNISRVHQISDANFLIRCADQKATCFENFQNPQEDSNIYALPKHEAPNMAQEIDNSRSNSTEINICLRAITNSTTTIQLKPAEGASAKLIAFYNPWSNWCKPSQEDSKNLLLLKPLDPLALFTRHYFELISILLVAAFAALLIAGLSMTAHKDNSKEISIDEK
ncbi:hypothetical protein [uncultured Cohaesibacter sp.]|uniref:hypothetical protein n=1 Tax=uncultured Cohaesibacter sp. TaxID=1002546 RepID=UPI0029C7F68A|nr:hypothetical protein [uncultured Cohaesibacter sp.]